MEESIRTAQLEEKRQLACRRTLGRAEAAAGDGLRAGGRSRAAVSGRADDGARSAGAAALWDLVDELKQAGRTIILTTHYMEEAERLCDRVAIMDHGRVIALGRRSS